MKWLREDQNNKTEDALPVFCTLAKHPLFYCFDLHVTISSANGVNVIY
jgi:hypothetical protein